MAFFWTTESFLLLHTKAKQWLNTRALNLSDGAGVGSPGGTNLFPSTRITKETEGKFFLGLALCRKTLFYVHCTLYVIDNNYVLSTFPGIRKKG
jgi:hypothetical protein